MKYETRTMQIIIVPEGQDSFSEYATSITIVDEGGGEFLEIHQQREQDKIRVDKNEWPALRDAIEKMISECRQ